MVVERLEADPRVIFDPLGLHELNLYVVEAIAESAFTDPSAYHEPIVAEPLPELGLYWNVM
jgi:hypothetical protein